MSGATQVRLPAEDVYATTKKIRFILERIERYRHTVKASPRVLDFGCGNAASLGRYVIAAGVEYVGVDLHAESLAYARANFSSPNASFVSEVPVDRQFDIILYSEVLEHLDHPVAVLRSHVPLLAERGIVLGSIPNGYGLTEIEKYVDRKLHLYQGMRWLWRCVRRAEPHRQAAVSLPYNYASGHVQFFTRRGFERTVGAAGLRLVELRNGSVMGADLSGTTFLRFRPLIELNVRFADYLPAWAAATWHFQLDRAEGSIG